MDLLWFDGTNRADNVQLQFRTATTANFIRKPRGLLSLQELDSIVDVANDEVVINALDGDDLVTVDAAFAIFGLVVGGTDCCTAPAGWVKASCRRSECPSGDDCRNRRFVPTEFRRGPIEIEHDGGSIEVARNRKYGF